MAACSAKPLVQKLGLKANQTALVKNAPRDYRQLLAPLPAKVSWRTRLGKDIDFIHLFTTSRRELERSLLKLKASLAKDGMLWVSWPKRASKIPTDVTEDAVRECALPLGLVDVKVCAVDETWSGLKLVIRKAKR